VESPENLEPGGVHYGWGADVVLKSGEGGWFHVPVPVPAMVDDVAARLKRVSILFETEGNAELRNVHVYDGSRVLQTFDNLNVSGKYRVKAVAKNTFILDPARSVRTGVGVSFFVQGGLLSGTESGIAPNRVIVAAVGAEYEVGRSFVGTIASAVTQLFTKAIEKGP
jgi:hypothetical protein